MRLPGNGVNANLNATAATANDSPCLFQILPYLEQDAYFRNVVTNTVIKTYLEPSRGRSGTVLSGATPTGPFPATDYAVNIGALYGITLPANATALRTGTLGMFSYPDGTSNTVLAGVKRMNPAQYNIDANDRPIVDRNAAGHTDLPGTASSLFALARGWSIYNTNTCTAGRDVGYTGESRVDQFGNPYPAGVLFCFVDGSVRSIAYTVLTGDRPAGSGDNVQNFLEAILTPNGGEVVSLE